MSAAFLPIAPENVKDRGQQLDHHSSCEFTSVKTELVKNKFVKTQLVKNKFVKSKAVNSKVWNSTTVDLRYTTSIDNCCVNTHNGVCD